MALPIAEEPQLKSKRPSNSAFKQQKLPAWQPILTAGTVLPTFFIIGLAFIPIGIGLYISSERVDEISRDYTYCKSTTSNITCAEALLQKETLKGDCMCSIFVTIPEPIEKYVYLYYGLTNYYQNHRRYVKSRDDNQLLGQINRKPSTDCSPYDVNGTGAYYVPCGAIANSLFSDVIKLYYYADEKQKLEISLLADGIAWATDKNVKFRNPSPQDNLEEAFKGKATPPQWSKPVWELDTADEKNNGFQNEDLIVWMRTAALPTFRKLYRRIDHSDMRYSKSLPAGTYEFEIAYRYPVTSFKGTKRVILSNTSWLGGKNSFLGIAYITVGTICLILAVVFLVIHFKFGKSTQDLVNISQRTPY